MRAAAVVVLISSIVLVSCSGGDDEGSPTTAAPERSVPSTESSTGSSPGSAGAPRSDQPEVTASASGSAEPAPSSDVPATSFGVVPVPETGVPGLDSDDSFCAAWSRFGGSWQVIQVAANFAPDPSVVPEMEIVAAPVVVAAYDQMFDVWPAELETERDVVADGYFGPLRRRAEAAIEALERVGASGEQIADLGDAWVAALAERRPDDPTVTPQLDDELSSLVDAAAAELLAERVEFIDDPSMRISVETPLTDVHLVTACPDQGALTGAEVDAG